MSHTTDNQNEIFDVVDEKDNVVGQATRGEVHKNKNLIHRSIGVAVFNSKGEMFLQKRSTTKDTDPLKWTISCSGHVCSRTIRVRPLAPLRSDPDFVYEEAVRRELFEELGLKDLRLEFVAKYICRAPNETETVVLFKTSYEGPFILHPEEILQGKFFTRKELKEAIQKGKIKLSFMGKVALEKIGWV